MNPNVLISSDYGAIIINRYDSFLGIEISRAGYLSKDDILLIKQLIDHRARKKENIVMYDVGANIGTHTLALSKLFKDKIKIRAFEAQRQIYYMLCGTIALNGLKNVFAENVAVADVNEGLLEIQLPNYNAINNFGGLELIPPVHSDNFDMVKEGTDFVPLRTLDSYHEDVDFIKMDIEGMESVALKGATQIFERSRPICFIEILKTDTEFVMDFFKNKNYIGYQKNQDLILIPIEDAMGVNDLTRIF